MAETICLPLDQPRPLHPQRNLRHLQERGPIHRVRTLTGDPAWLVIDYELARDLLTDSRLGRAHPEPEKAARSGYSALADMPFENFATEQEDHARFRALIHPLFTPTRMREMRSRVEVLVKVLLDEMKQPADLIESLALPLPLAVICELLGVPDQDRHQLHSWSLAVSDKRDHKRSLEGMAKLWAYGGELVQRKRREPAGDFVSILLATDLSDAEVVLLSMALLFGGQETPVSAIGGGALLLLSHPAEWNKLLANPGLIPVAVEEILRTFDAWGGAAVIIRYARADLRLGEVTIGRGELVIFDRTAANHDPTVFAEPDRFDITRNAVHLSFGYGARYCVGAALARMELVVAFTELITRFPNMRLAVPVDRLTLDERMLLPGLASLPVVW